MNNHEIDECFDHIKHIAENYLSMHYPDAPDPDDFMALIEAQVKKYRNMGT